MDNIYGNNKYNQDPIQMNTMPLRNFTFFLSKILLTTGVMFILLEEYFYSTNKEISFFPDGIMHLISLLAGTGVVLALAIFIIYRFKSINIRANGLLIVSITFILAQGITTLGQFSIMSMTNSQNKAADHSLKVIASKLISDNKIQTTEYSESTYGVNGPILSKISMEYNKYLDTRIKWRNDLDSFNKLSKSLDKKIFSDKKSLSKAKKEFIKFKTQMDELQNAKDEFFAQAEKSAKEIKLAKRYKGNSIKNLKDCIASESEFTDTQIQNISQICDLNLRAVQFFDKLNGNFQIKGKNYLFNDQKDVDTINKISEELDSLIKAQDTWKKQYTDKRKSLYDELVKNN
ncbi:MAG: hypothetical protein Q8942_12175 [Bacillota bacterium]|nr:hypothetical protein [Bacillota bacterium]